MFQNVIVSFNYFYPEKIDFIILENALLEFDNTIMDDTQFNLTNNYEIQLNLSKHDSFIQLFLCRKD